MNEWLKLDDETVRSVGKYVLLQEIYTGRTPSGLEAAAYAAGSAELTPEQLRSYGYGLSECLGNIVGRAKTPWEMAGKLGCQAEFLEALREQIKIIESK